VLEMDGGCKTVRLGMQMRSVAPVGIVCRRAKNSVGVSSGKVDAPTKNEKNRLASFGVRGWGSKNLGT